jgi:hypothetical protein
MVGACGIICFPSEAALRSDECRLELALGRIFGEVCNFKIFPVLLDSASLGFLDHRIAQTQGRKIHVEQVSSGQFRIEAEAIPSIMEFCAKLSAHAADFSVTGDVLSKLYDRFANLQLPESRLFAPQLAATPIPTNLTEIVKQYREAPDWQHRRALDERIAAPNRPYSLRAVMAQLTRGSDEASAMSAAMSLAGAHQSDTLEEVMQLVQHLLQSDSPRVRFRVGNALRKRTQERLIQGGQRMELLCLLELAIAREDNSEVANELSRARSAIAAI